MGKFTLITNKICLKTGINFPVIYSLAGFLKMLNIDKGDFFVVR